MASNPDKVEVLSKGKTSSEILNLRKRIKGKRRRTGRQWISTKDSGISASSGSQDSIPSRPDTSR